MAEPIFYHGTVTGSEGGLYEVVTEDGQVLSCPARGVFRHEGLKVLVGDRVTVRFGDPLPEDAEPLQKVDKNGASRPAKVRNGRKREAGLSIFAVDSRRNTLIRPPMANLDLLFVAFAAAFPDPLPINIDKLLAIAEQNEIEPVVLITKSDLAPEKAASLEKLYRQCGFSCFVTRPDGDLSSLHAFLREHAAGKISAFAGASGVGKSTLLTALFPDLNLQTGTLSRKIERGKHTTRQARLYPLSFGNAEDGTERRGFLADTPGFGLLDFVSFDFFSKEELPFNFREFVPLLGTCRYTRCTHRTEEGCAILAAIQDGRIPKERHESYCAIYEELKDKHEWDKKPKGGNR